MTCSANELSFVIIQHTEINHLLFFAFYMQRLMVVSKMPVSVVHCKHVNFHLRPSLACLTVSVLAVTLLEIESVLVSAYNVCGSHRQTNSYSYRSLLDYVFVLHIHSCNSVVENPILKTQTWLLFSTCDCPTCVTIAFRYSLFTDILLVSSPKEVDSAKENRKRYYTAPLRLYPWVNNNQ